MFKKFFFTFIGVLVIVGGLAGIKYLQISAMITAGAAFTQPPTTISAFEVKSEPWESTLASIGTLEAARGLLVTSDLSGRVAEILFNAGEEVKAGDLLVVQDTSSEKAQLRALQATADRNKNNLDRITELFRKKVASKAELDDARSDYQSAVASVDNIRASIEKKNIRAPFDGRLGIRLVNLGQTINAGESVVSLQATNKMYINFFLPQQLLAQVKTGLPVRLTTDAVPGKVFEGTINAIDPEIEAITRSVKVQALLDNPEQALLPGMFANIEVVLPTEEDVLLIPVTAVQYATFGDSVFIIESAEQASQATETLQVRQEFVRLGEMRGDFITVEKGLAVGQQVVSAGGFKLRNGAPVVINNAISPDFQLEPQVNNR